MSSNLRCPTCNQPTVWKDNAFRPFCSERCKLIDLGQWLTEKYKVPGENVSSANNPEGSDDDEGPGNPSQS